MKVIKKLENYSLHNYYLHKTIEEQLFLIVGKVGHISKKYSENNLDNIGESISDAIFELIALNKNINPTRVITLQNDLIALNTRKIDNKDKYLLELFNEFFFHFKKMTSYFEVNKDIPHDIIVQSIGTLIKMMKLLDIDYKEILLELLLNKEGR